MSFEACYYQNEKDKKQDRYKKNLNNTFMSIDYTMKEATNCGKTFQKHSNFYCDLAV